MKYTLLLGCLLFAAQAPLAHAQATPQAATSAAEQTKAFSGKVVETMNAGGYTYVLVDTGKQKLWAAAPQFAVKVGDSVSIPDGMAMEGYHSKTLNRNFDVVYFTGNVIVNGAHPGAGAGAKMAEFPKNHPPIGGAAPAAKIDVKGIKKAEGGKTVEEIVAQKAKLKGQVVKVRGKVVKYNPMILGRNWLHIQDGTGKPGSNDLLVTTSSEAKTGDTVLVTGKVATDKDFGSGYKYDVLLEDAKVVVEQGSGPAAAKP